MKHDWEYKKLGEVAESDLGKTLNQSKDTGIFQPYLCSINIQWDAIDLSIVKQARFEESEFDRYSVKSGDLLVCEGGDTGRAAIWNGGPMLYQNALHRIRFNDRIIPRFALLYLRHLKMNGDIDSKYSKGVTIKHLVKSSLNSIPIPLPPLSTQQSIVSELDSLSKIIADCKETLKDYDALEQSIFYDMFGDPVKNEKGWEVKKLGEVTKNIFAGGDKPKDFSETKTQEYCYPIIANGDGEKGILGYSNTYRVSEAAVTIGARGASIGNCRICREKFLPVVRLITIIVGDIIDVQYLYFIVKKIKYDISGAGQAQLTVPNIVSENIIFPPLPLQQQFASKIEAIEQMKVETKKALQEAETLFQARMDYWFN